MKLLTTLFAMLALTVSVMAQGARASDSGMIDLKQPRPVRKPRWSPPIMLVPVPEYQLSMRGDVRKSLNIDDAQVRKIAEATIKAYPKDLGESGDPEGQWKRVLANQDEAARRQMSLEQRKRLYELWLQYNGYLTTADYDVAKALQLTEAQRNAIAEIIRQVTKKMKAYAAEEEARRIKPKPMVVKRGSDQDNGKNSAEVPAATDTKRKPLPDDPKTLPAGVRPETRNSYYREIANGEIEKVLTAEQKAMFKKMGGEEFKFGDSEPTKLVKPGGTSTGKPREGMQNTQSNED